MRVALALLPLLAACDIMFQLRPVKSLDGSVTGDTQGSGSDSDMQHLDGPSPTCALVDDFNDNNLSASWQVLDPGMTAATVVEQNQQLAIRPRTTVNGSNGVVTSALPFTGSSVTVQVSPASELSSNIETTLVVGRDSTNYVQIVTSSGSLGTRLVSNTSQNGMNDTYSSSAHRWWRLTHDATAGAVRFQFSPDGVTFTTLHSFAIDFDVSLVTVQMYVSSSNGGSNAPGEADFDNFSLCLAP